VQRPLQLKWHNVNRSEALAEEVRGEVARLEHYFGRITGCDVTLEAPSRHHRQSGSNYRVRVELSVPGDRLVVGRAPPKSTKRADIYAAVKDAFREARRQLEDYVRRLDTRVKTHTPPALAEVARIQPEDGFGFLQTPDGREIYFHEHSVLRGGFKRLAPGSEVRFVEEAGDKGPQASTVTLLHPRRKKQVGAEGQLELLPAPNPKTTPLHGVIAVRRSGREFGLSEVTAAERSALLWAGQGVTSAEGARAAPSVGGLYPLTLSLVDAHGVWRYLPAAHALSPMETGDHRAQLAAATHDQAFLAKAPVTIAVTARPTELTARYGDRAERYCMLEAGHVAENVLLMAAALGLTAVPVADFDDAAVRSTLGLGAGYLPLYLLAVGRPPAGGGAP
jgi:ribosomal subunit interface protein